MKVVFTDCSFSDLAIETEILRSLGVDLISGQFKTAELLAPFVGYADAVITQFAHVTAEVIAAMQKAHVIVGYGVGYDNVDVAAARDRNIPVCNVPDYCMDEVADYTLGFILSSARRLPENWQALQKGKWGLGVPLEQMRALKDQTVGILGLGRIGKAVADRLRFFQCRMLALGSREMVGVEFLHNVDNIPNDAYFLFAAVKIRDCHGGLGRAIPLY